jgi:DHA1 family tetracycline resistance protein-like MFS transporter
VSETTPLEPTAGHPERRPAALGFVYAAILMNVLSMGVIIPVFPPLVKSLAHVGDAGAAQITGVFGAAWALMQLIFAPIFGNLSDRFGRRPVLLVAMFGLAFDYLVMALAPSIAWLFVGRLIAGMTSASSSAAGAYVADVSTPDNRARNFGRFQAAANAGILIGPLLGGLGFSLFHNDPRAPFWIAAGLALMNGLYGVFFLPESLVHERRAPFRWKRANPIGAAQLLITTPGLLGMAGILFLAQFAGYSFNSVFQFYTHFRFGWGPPQIMILLMVLSGGGILMQSFVAGWVVGWLGERRSVIAGMALSVFGFAGLGLASTLPFFWAAVGILVLGGLSFPSLISLLTQRVGVDQQGQLQGALQILFASGGLVAPLAFTNIFAWSIGTGRGLGLPGLSLLVGSGLVVVALTFAYLFARPVPTLGPPTLLTGEGT